MCDVPVLYATTEGHTRRIAEHLAHHMRQHGLDSRPIPLASSAAANIAWERVRGAVVGASLHATKHQKVAREFVRRHRRHLSAVPSVFVSVSLAAASKSKEQAQAAQGIADSFCAETGWQPYRIASVAGCLAYTKYNWFVRLFMRHIARKEGASTDTTRDHDYTDWRGIERLADELAHQIHAGANPAASEEPVARAAS
jgi:menaquinone-dependent protoporphyrinogen oxidase